MIIEKDKLYRIYITYSDSTDCYKVLGKDMTEAEVVYVLSTGQKGE
jgi:hypothetical protein